MMFVGFRRIWVVTSYSDGPLCAYKTEEEAIESRDTYNAAGLYPLEDTHIEEVLLAD